MYYHTTEKFQMPKHDLCDTSRCTTTFQIIWHSLTGRFGTILVLSHGIVHQILATL